ncbi:MAG: PstS family phosphate ABC transporter substrate-binding protein [Drouetiella hepatica Uher 2000/2452]|uniref:Phosphate-binding protein n=1 Tax=Drouetiella hepatica Uher 2000/2452 TaxID=904376 RepID=A0A951UKY5_9CYAN|nr:PstS family phosphate ABC transporter substrate-binding protein [Drouetiella hepatica Uher 2000/2452]
MVFQQKPLGIYLSVVAIVIGLAIYSTSRSGGTQASSPVPLSENVKNDVIEIDGSSTVYPITDAIVHQFQQSYPRTKVSSTFSGTRGGFDKFCAGQIDISNASRPISTQELLVCRQAAIRFIELPIAFDALTVVVNPKNTWAKDMTIAELKTLWESAAQGKIKTWDQVRSTWPSRPIALFGAGADSGTYDYFAGIVTGAEKMRSDYTGSEDDNILVEGVNKELNALGYFGLYYYEYNKDKVKPLAINGVLPSVENVKNATYQPLSRPLFIYVNAQAAQQNPALSEFIAFYLKNAERVSASVGYVPLPGEAYEIGQTHFYQGKVGTAYDGKPQPNLTIGEVLQKEKSF